MIKITIIVVLILLLLITLYSYYCLSSRMIEFEKARMEFIINKENELKNLEKKIKTVSECSNKNEQYQQAIKNINTIIGGLNLPPGSICAKYENNKDKQLINNIKSIIGKENLNEQELMPNINHGELRNVMSSENKLNIFHEVPINFTHDEIPSNEIKNITTNVKSELTSSESELKTELELKTESENFNLKNVVNSFLKK